MLLQELSDAFGPSGCEDQVRRILARALHGTVDELKSDALGNLLAFKRGTGPHPRLRVLVDAHMDEVGLMITRIEGNGLLGFRVVGGIDERLLLAKRVVVGASRVPGVILAPPIHLTKEEQRHQVIKVDQLAVDIGTSSQEETRSLVRIGDYAAFDTRFAVLTDDGLRVAKGKALDDRAGCAAAVALAQDNYSVDLWLSLTTQEEVGLRGARVAAFGIDPHLALALEGTVCDDAPKDSDSSPTTLMGQGPAITLMDRSFVADRQLVKLMIQVAEEARIPYQFKQPGIGSTNAGAIHLTKAGVPAAAVAVPCRYIHTPASLMSLADLDNLVALTRAVLHALPQRYSTPERQSAARRGQP